MGSGGEQGPSIYSLEGPRYSQSLERGLAILGCFTPQTPVRGIADIGDTLEMSRPTTHRYVVTLLALGYLEQGAGRKYRLGLRVTDLGMSVLNSTGLREHAHALLEELRQSLGYSVSLSVLDGTEIVYVDRARSYTRGQINDVLDLQPGSRLPAYCTALGKILLAHLSEPEHKEILAEIKLRKRGPNTIKNKKELDHELANVRDTGIALENEENARELIAIAAPIYDQSEHVVAAVDVSLSAALIQIEEMAGALAPHLLATADRISQRLGHRRG
jgi:IclR family pca regulon transcriptional regulator